MIIDPLQLVMTHKKRRGKVNGRVNDLSEGPRIVIDTEPTSGK